MTEPTTIAAAALELHVSPSTLRRWLAAGAPVSRRGGRGRGKRTLIDVDAVRAWTNACDGEAALAVFAGKVPELVADAVWQAFLMSGGPQKRINAGLLAASWYLVTAAVTEAAGTEAPKAVPDTIERLRKIATR